MIVLKKCKQENREKYEIIVKKYSLNKDLTDNEKCTEKNMEL